VCKRTHVFRAEDPVGKFILYLLESRHLAGKICVISHNSRGYDAKFLLRKFLKLRWTIQLIMDDTKILIIIVEKLHFLDSLNFLPMSQKITPKSFDLTCKKGYYRYFFNTGNKLEYVGPYPEPKVYGAVYIFGMVRVAKRHNLL